MTDTFEISLERDQGYRFRTDFTGMEIPPLFVDEPPPLGTGSGPNPGRLLATAVGNCLTASLIFCLGKARVEVGGVRTTVVGRHGRNEQGRLRIRQLDVVIALELPADVPAGLRRCLPLFEDYCVVTASVRKGIDVGVTVTDSAGHELFSNPS